MKRCSILITALLLIGALAWADTGTLSASSTPRKSSGPGIARAESAELQARFSHGNALTNLSHMLMAVGQSQVRSERAPQYPPAPGQEWVQVTPYVWHYSEQVDPTRRVERYYTVGLDGLAWQADNLVRPHIKKLEARLAENPADAGAKAELATYLKRLDRMMADLERRNTDDSPKGTDPTSPLYGPASEAPMTCNYAIANASIGSQISGNGQACSNNNSWDSTYYEWDVYRGGHHEHDADYNASWSAFGLTRARIPGSICRMDSWTGAYWGPFYWDRQDAYDWAEDANCQ